MNISKIVPMWVAALLIFLLLTPMAVATPCEAEETVVAQGDLNGDFEIDMRDAFLLFRYASGADVPLTIHQIQRVDMNADGDIDTRDAYILYRYAAGQGFTPPGSTQPTTSTTTTTTTTQTVSPAASTTATTTPTGVRGIDVSYSQGTVDWAAVKEQGMEFALIRCGYGQDQTDQDDDRWEENTAACEQYGIPYGAYLFCYARNAEEAAGEAKHALRMLEGKNLTLPVFLDMEYSAYQGDLSNETYAAIATVFCETLAAEGYKVGVYANYDWWVSRLTDDCFDRWYRWVAQYNATCEYSEPYHIWQYTDRATVDGINGYVDANVCYLDPRQF